LLIPSVDIDSLVLFCTSLAYETAFCSPLKGPVIYLSNFLLFCIYFSIVLVCSGSTTKKRTIIDGFFSRWFCPNRLKIYK